MTREEFIQLKKKQLEYWREVARDKTSEAGKAVRKADALEKEVYELENGKKKPQSPVS